MDNQAGESRLRGLSERDPSAEPASAFDVSSLTGRAGQPLLEHGDWKLDFHGFIRAPMRVGMSKRDEPTPEQSKTTFHSPVVPDDQHLSWQHTNHNPRDWAEIYFSYGNSIAKGTVSIQGFNFTDAAWNEEAAQFGIAQGYVTLTPPLPVDQLKFEWKVGAFANRYGMAGRYDAGEYDTYLFGRTHSMGETRKLQVDWKDLQLEVQHGFGATRPNPSIYNRARFTLLHHAHAALRYDNFIEFGGHYLTAFAQEEDRDGELNPDAPDGRMTVIGPELRVDGRNFGYYYVGMSYIDAKSATTVGPAIEVIHAKGGGEFNLGIVDNYLEGPDKQSNGNGNIITVEAQAEHSVQKALAGPEGFWGEGRDLSLKLYTMVNLISSEDPDVDGITKMKYGADVLFSAFPWLGVATRYDRVQPNNRIPAQSFSIVSPRLVFKSQWVSHERITLQYSRYLYNTRVCEPDSDQRLCVQPPAAPPPPEGFGSTSGNQAPNMRGAPTTVPDENVFTVQATMWW